MTRQSRNLDVVCDELAIQKDGLFCTLAESASSARQCQDVEVRRRTTSGDVVCSVATRFVGSHGGRLRLVQAGYNKNVHSGLETHLGSYLHRTSGPIDAGCVTKARPFENGN